MQLIERFTWIYLHIGIHLFLVLKSTCKKEERVGQTKCQSPSARPFYKNNPIACIYGIEFTTGFDGFLFYNDPKQNKRIAELLDEAGSGLCEYVSTTSEEVDPFQEVSILKDNNYIDLFITCCSKCPYINEIDWRIYLKSQFLIHHYAIIETHGNQKNYIMTPRIRNLSTPSYCITEIYRMVPVTGNNDICFTYGQQKFNNPIAGQKYPSNSETFLRMGHYNATAAKYPLGHHCIMNHNSLFDKDESCLFALYRTDFKYFCCCYDVDLVVCQRLGANLLRKDDFLKDRMFCAMGKLVITEDSVMEENKIITFVAPIFNLTKIMEQSSKNKVCYMRLTEKSNIVDFATDESLCKQSDALDIRLRPIIRTACVSLKDYYTFCPLVNSDAIKQYDIVCCCNNQHFCNYNRNIQLKIAAENSSRPQCFYNERYQYLFNQYYVRSMNNRDVCLLHYVDRVTLQDMGRTNVKDGSIYHSYPGNGFHPIDFSYIFLENDTCTYVEVEISQNFMQRARGCFSKNFETNYMPLKLFVCSCTLDENNNHCDRELTKEIADRAKKFPMESLTKCVKFDTVKLAKMLLNESELVYVRHTSYCFVQVTKTTNIMSSQLPNIQFEIKADAMTRSMAAYSKKHFDHIAYSMYNFFL
ncbi:Poly(ADP-ribose) glycohydrolase [Dirofilaria immitis]